METKEILAKLAELETQMKAIEEDGTEQHVAAIALRRQLAIERNAHANHVADFCKRIADLEARLAKAEAVLDRIIDHPHSANAPVTFGYRGGIRDGHRCAAELAQEYRKEFPREIEGKD